ncbi:MAG: YHS domain-containing protein [Thermodesulfobacteriota bacterium]
MKKIKLLALSLTLAMIAVGLVLAPVMAAPTKPQTTCPVLGGPINKDVYMDYKGQRIYFCCKGCDAEFKKDPEKYLKKMQEQGITPEKSPAAPEKK